MARTTNTLGGVLLLSFANYLTLPFGHSDLAIFGWSKVTKVRKMSWSKVLTGSKFSMLLRTFALSEKYKIDGIFQVN